MSTRSDPIETYYQAIFKKLLHVLPYAVLFIIAIRIILQKLKHYLIAKLNEFFNFIILLFNCFKEAKESTSSFEFQLEIEDIQVDESKTINAGTCITVDKNIDSFNNALIFSQNVDDSVSDIEMLRGDSDEETNVEEEKKLAEIIEFKRVILRNKRQQLCGRLQDYKLMEFHVDDPRRRPTLDTNHSLNLPIPTFLETRSESPIPVAEEIDFHQIPATPASPLQNSPPFFPEDKESYSLTYEHMLERAIQASLDDLATKQVHDSSLSPQWEESSNGKIPGQPSTGAAYKDPSVPSPSQENQHQTTPTLVNRSPQLQRPTWKKNYTQYVDDPDTQQEDSQNIVVEDFMDADRYVGDKGKRPQSGRYAYKKRVKPSMSEPEEQSNSDIGDVTKKRL